MKTILVATDFSESSDQASKYAVELAKAFKAKIVLYNAYQLLVPFPDGAVVMDPEVIRAEVRKLLEVQSINLPAPVLLLKHILRSIPSRAAYWKLQRSKAQRSLSQG